VHRNTGVTRKRLIIASATGLLAGAAIIVLLAGNPGAGEPMYEGRTLSRWLQDHVENSSANPPIGSAGWKEAELALRQIGTNAIPTLLKMLSATESHAFVIQAHRLANRMRLTTNQYRYATQRNEEACYAFKILGASASNAVPELIRIYQQKIQQTNATPISVQCASVALGNIGAPASNALPVLFRQFTNTDNQKRFDAVSAAMRIGNDPAVMLPAMIPMLKDPQHGIRWNASSSFERLGWRARAAAPDLLAALNDPTTDNYKGLKEQIETVLWRIAPDKVGKPLVIEETTPLIAGGVTAELVETVYNGQRRTLIQTNRAVPCLSQFAYSAPRGTISFYRRAPGTPGDGHFLGAFEVVGIPAAPTNVNISLLCIIVDRRIVLNARENSTRQFLQIRRADYRPE
jgi:hypothetical protein